MYGQAGVGKTTFLKKIAVDWARHVQRGIFESELDKVPFLLFMVRHKSNERDDFPTILKEQIHITEFHTITEYIKRNPGSITVLLDSLDQISCKIPSEFLDEEIREKLRFIVTTQLQSDTKDSLFRSLVLAGISFTNSFNNIKDYIEQFYENISTSDEGIGSELFQTLKNSHGLIEQAQNPTTLQQMCIVNMKYAIKKEASITEILQKYVCYRLSDYDRKESHNSVRLSEKDIFKKYKNKILNMGKIAFTGLKEGYICLHYNPDDVKQIEPKAFDIGLMFEINDEKAAFHSKMLQEFLAAYYVKHVEEISTIVNVLNRCFETEDMENRKGIDHLLNLCTTAEHFTGFLTILTFIMNLSSKMNKQIPKKIGRLISELQSTESEHQSMISDHEIVQFLLTMLRGSRNIKFSLPQKVIVYLDKEGRSFIGKSIYQTFFEQDGSRIISLSIVTGSTGSLDQAQNLNAPKLEKLEINFSDAEPRLDGLKQILMKSKKKKCPKLQCLSLSQCHVTDENAKTLLLLLKGNCPVLNCLTFQECTASLDSLAQLTQFRLQHNCKVESYPACNAEDDPTLIDMCKGQYKPPGAAYNTQELTDPPAWNELESIDLSGKEITPEGIHVLARVATFTVRLQHLDLSNCHLGDNASFRNLIESVSQNCQGLISLNLNESRISPISAQLLCTEKVLIPKLEELHLVHCLKENVHSRFSELKEIFENMTCSLKTLDLSKNTVDAEAYKVLSRSLEFLPNLQRLKLNHCIIKSDFRSLFSNVSHSIEHLDLGGNQMEGSAIDHFVNMTHSRTSIKVLNFGKIEGLPEEEKKHGETLPYGFSDHVDLYKIFRALETNCRDLETCDISYHSIDDNAMDALACLTESVPGLKTLCLTHCDRKQDKHIEKLVQKIKTNCKAIEKLYLDENSVYPETLVFLTKLIACRRRALDIKYPECCTADTDSFVSLCKGFWNVDAKYPEKGKKQQSWEDIEELDLLTATDSPIKLSENGASALVLIIQDLPKLKSCSLPSKTVTNEEKMEELIKSLPNRMERLILKNNVIGKTAMEELVRLAKRTEGLKHLNISNCQINKDTGTEKLVEALSESCPSLEEVDLSENETYPSVLVDIGVLLLKISETSCENLSKYLPKSATDSENLVSLLNNPKSWDEMKNINLIEEQPSFPYGVEAIEKLLLQTPNILNIVFRKCAIENLEGPLKSMTTNCHHLKSLLLQGNKLDSSSQDELCQLLDTVPCLYELNIAKCGITGDETWAKLANSLSKCSKLNILDISGNPLTTSVSKLACVPPQATGLEELYMNDCLIESGFDIFVNSLGNSCHEIRQMDISKNRLQETDAMQLSISLKMMSKLAVLQLASCGISDVAMSAVVESLDSHCDGVTKLNLLGNHATPLDIALLTKFATMEGRKIDLDYPECSTDDDGKLVELCKFPFEKMRRVLAVDLSYAKLTTNGMEALIFIFSTPKTTELLSFGGCQVDDQTIWEKFLNVLSRTVPELEMLDLSGNMIENFQNISKMIDTAPNLQHLYLIDCKLEEKSGFPAFIKLIQNSFIALETLSLTDNFMSPVSILQLTEEAKRRGWKLEIGYPSFDPSIPANNYLYKLLTAKSETGWENQVEMNFSGTNITKPGIEAVARLLKHTPQLETFSIGSCGIVEQDAMELLIKSMEGNLHKLKSLNLNGNSIDNEIVSNLQHTINGNRKLKHLYLKSCLKEGGASKVISTIAETKVSLAVLDLSWNFISKEDVILMSSMEWIDMEDIYLANCQVTDSDALKSLLKRIETTSMNLHVLVLSSNNLSKEGTTALRSVAESCQQLHTICVPDCHITDDLEAQLLLTSLRDKCPHLKKIDFRKNELGPEIHVFLTEMCLLSNKQLQIKYPDIPRSHQISLYDLCQAKTPWAEIQEIDLKSDVLTEIKEKAMKAVAVVVKYTKNLTSLNVASFTMKPTMTAEIIENITNKCPEMRNLNLSDNQFDQNTINALRKMVEQRGNLQILNISRCNIDNNVEMVQFIETLRNKLTGKLTNFDLSGNVCDPHVLVKLTILSTELGTTVEYPDCCTGDSESVLSLLKGSPKWETNREISGEFSQEALLAVPDVIRLSPLLEILNVGNKLAGLEKRTSEKITLEKLVESVVSENLRILNLSGHKVASDNKNFLELLRRTPQLQSMHLVGCGFSETAKLGDVMTELEQNHNELVTLDISENYVGPQGTSKLTKLVQTKASLKHLYLRRCDMVDNEATKLLLHAIQNKCLKLETINLSENDCCAEVIAMLSKMRIKVTNYPTCEPKESDKLVSLLKERETSWEKLDTVDLTETVITEPHGVDGLAYMVESLHHLSYFSIMNCNVKEGACQKKLIVNLSKNCRMLKKLNLGGNSLKKESIIKLQETVSSFQHMQSINLSACENNCDIGFRGLLDELSNSATCSQLTELDLSSNICDPQTISKLSVYCHKTDVKANHPNCESDVEAVIKYLRDHSEWEKIDRLNLSEQTVSRNAFIGLVAVTPYMPEVQELLFSKCKMEDKHQLANLIGSLEDKAPKLKHIDFSFVSLTGEPIEAVTKLMYKESPLTTLNLEHCKLVKDRPFELFCKRLSDACQNLKTLNMSHNQLGTYEIIIADVVKNLQNIETLLLEDTKMSCSGVISAIRENCKQIHTLSLKGNSASMLDIFELTKMIVDKRIERKNLQYPDCPHTQSPKLLDMIKSENTPWEKLDKIDVAQEIIPEDGVEALVMVLQVTKEVKVINLNGCIFDKPKATNEILKAISYNCASLESLDISKTAVTQEGSKHLCKIIQASVNLSTIKLANCDIETEGCDAIITHIANREKLLKFVNFSGTKARPKSIVALTKMKTKGCKLEQYPECYPGNDKRLMDILKGETHPWDTQETIDISNENISDEEFCALVEVIKASPKLTVLNLDSCYINSDEYISNCLESLTEQKNALKTLNLSNNCVGPKSWESLVNLSSSVPSLQHLYLRNTEKDKFTEPISEKIRKLSGNLKELKTLELSGYNIGRFSSELPKLFPSIETLQLEDCNLQDSDVLQLSTDINQMPSHSLGCLNLSRNKALPTTLVHLAKLKIASVEYPDCQTSPEPPELIKIFANKANRWQNMGNVKIEKMSQNGVDALIDIFQEAKGICSFDMNEGILDEPSNVANLLLAMSKSCTKLQRFRIGGIKIDQNTYSAICNVVNVSSGIKTFAINKCSMSDKDAMMHILKSLQRHKDVLQDLDISGNPVGSGIANLVDLTNESKNLKRINIAGCNCNDIEELGKLVDNLSDLCPEKDPFSLKTVNFTGETVLYHTYMKLKKMINKNVQVALPACGGGGALADYCAMKDPSTITHINLIKEQIPSEGIEALKTLCVEAQNLETLWLPPCLGISDKEMADLLYCCQPGYIRNRSHKKLTDLDISGNALGTNTLDKIEIGPLKRLRLAACKLTGKDCTDLLDKKGKKCKNLERLDLGKNSLGNDNLQKVFTTKTKDFRLTKLKELCLSDCNISTDSMSHIIKCVSDNSNLLKVLDLSGNSCTADVIALLTIKSKEGPFTPKYPDCTSDSEEFIEFCKDTKHEWTHIEHLGRDKYLKSISPQGSEALGMILKYTCKLKSLELVDMSHDKMLSVTKSLSLNCPGLETLLLSKTDISSTSDTQWEQLFDAKPRLSSLTFHKCTLQCTGNESIFKPAVGKCKQLKILEITECSLSPKEIKYLNDFLKTLQHLSTVTLKHTGDISGLTPSKYSKKVEELDFEGSTSNPYTLALLAQRCMFSETSKTKIKQFPICSTKDRDHLKDIYTGKTRWPVLECLDLDDSVSPSGGKALGVVINHATSLKAINLKESRNYSGQAIANIFKGIQRPQPLLHKISFQKCEMDASDECFKQILELLKKSSQPRQGQDITQPELGQCLTQARIGKKLYISRQDQFSSQPPYSTLAGIGQFSTQYGIGHYSPQSEEGNYLPQLKELSVGLCNNNSVLIELVTTLKYNRVIEKLDFGEACCDFPTYWKLKREEENMSKQIQYTLPMFKDEHQIREEKLRKLVQLRKSDFEKEKQIDLSNCQINNFYLAVIKNALEKTSHLTKFSLAGCTGIKSDEDLFQDILQQLTELDELEILDFSGITIENSMIKTLENIYGKTKWKEVYLNGSNVKDLNSLLCVLKEKCPDLTKLHMQGVAFTAEDLETLTSVIKACPSIVELNISECIKEHKTGKWVFGKDKFLGLIKEIENSKSNKKTIDISQNFDEKYVQTTLEPIIDKSCHTYILKKETKHEQTFGTDV